MNTTILNTTIDTKIFNMANKNTASLSLDLDNKWAYLKMHGDSDWENFPSYFDVVVPRMLEFFDQHSLTATVFVVGQDAEIERNRSALAAIAEQGHEIGNHSFNHEPWLHLYTPTQLDEEFEKSESAIRAATGKDPVGFRGPGFSLSNQVLRTLVKRGYEYDCSTFPTYLGPIARAYYFFKSSLSKAEKEDRKELFGSWKDGFQSNHPFEWESGNDRLLEIPVTTMPIFKVPIHASYVMYLATYSRAIAKAYFWSSMQMCKWMGVQPSLLLHPLDFMGVEDDSDLSFFPGMNQPAHLKIKLLSDCMKMMQKQFDVVTLREHASRLKGATVKFRDVESAPVGAV
ncbi:MAG: hypothetical protein ACI814_004105 [Mariniblastus sp.]